MTSKRCYSRFYSHLFPKHNKKTQKSAVCVRQKKQGQGNHYTRFEKSSSKSPKRAIFLLLMQFNQMKLNFQFFYKNYFFRNYLYGLQNIVSQVVNLLLTL